VFAIRMLVTLAILVPIWLIRQPKDMVETFVIAVIAFGAGHIVAALIKAHQDKRRRPHDDKPR